MNSTLNAPAAFTTYLSPGQRFHASDQAAALGSHELTVARLVRDRLGMLHVTLRTAEGREISAFAEQVEAAIAEGMLRPVEGELFGVAC